MTRAWTIAQRPAPQTCPADEQGDRQLTRADFVAAISAIEDDGALQSHRSVDAYATDAWLLRAVILPRECGAPKSKWASI
jgi:hypothetical protein